MTVRFAGGTRVLQLPALLVEYESHRGIAKRIVGILADAIDVARAGGHTISAAIALVRIDGDEEIAGTVLIAVVSDHVSDPGIRGCATAG